MIRYSEEMFLPGLKFKSITFAMDAEVKNIREDQNEVDVILKPSDGHQWIETWNLEHVKWAFERNDYFIPEPEVNFGI